MITHDLVIIGLEVIKKYSTNKVDIAIINDAIKEIEKYEELINKTSEENIGDFSDGYHTFNELYHHRAILFSVICNNNKTIAWKSKQHHDGTMYDNMFIVGIDTPKGQASYHYNITPYWDLFEVKELEQAPLWDGYTPEQSLERILSIRTNAEIEKYDPVLEAYAKHLAKMFGQYSTWQYSGKNGANSDNEKGYWRGMADGVLAFLNDLRSKGLIKHLGLYDDPWPADTNEIRYVEISDINVTFGLQPNDDIYTATIPELLTVAIPLPSNFDQLSDTTKLEYFNTVELKPIVLETLQDAIEFDTPDDPEFEVSDVDFNYLLKSK